MSLACVASRNAWQLTREKTSTARKTRIDKSLFIFFIKKQRGGDLSPPLVLVNQQFENC